MLLNYEWEILRAEMPEGDVAWAKELQERSAQVHKGYRSQRRLTADYDFIGAIGELRFYNWLQANGYTSRQQFEWTGYVRHDLQRDEWDFKFAGYAIDVKTRGVKYEYNIGEFEVHVSDPEKGKGNQAKKPMDIYVFAQYQRNHNICSLLGWAWRDEFFNLGTHRLVGKGEVLATFKDGREITADQPCHLVKVRDLTPMHQLLSLPAKL